jgi:hypothetical protein
MSLLVEIMRRLSEIDELNKALKKYSECLDVEPVVPVAGVYEACVGTISCDKDKCTVELDLLVDLPSRLSMVVLPDGRVIATARKWTWLVTTEELDLLFQCIERLRGKIEERIRELDKKIEEMKTLLAEATLLCP